RRVIRLVGERDRSFPCHRTTFDVNGAIEPTAAFKRAPHLRQVAAEFDHDRGVRVFETTHEFGFGERARNDREHIIALRNRSAGCRPAPRHATHPGDDFGTEAERQAHVEVHVGTVEQRIALAYHGDEAAIVEMRGHLARRVVVERADDVAVACFVLWQLGCHRKDQRHFTHIGFEITRSSGPGVSGVRALGEMCHHVGSFEHANCFERNEFGVARSDADTNKLSPAAHIPGLASAFTAAAVIALPPIRPSTVRKGTPRGFAANASLASAAPTKPTGMPRIAAGLGAPASSISSKRNKAVGALPTATTAPPRRSRHNSSAAAERVVSSSSASRATCGSRSVQTTPLCAGRRARVTPCAAISESHRMGAPRASAARAVPTTPSPNTIRFVIVTSPQAWTMRTTMSASCSENRDRSVSARMIANERS